VVNKGITIKTHPLPAFVRKIQEAGGLINYVKGEHA
jgi:3-isopropylmalate/(R)-2-methylmalate dehydratase small subunit